MSTNHVEIPKDTRPHTSTNKSRFSDTNIRGSSRVNTSQSARQTLMQQSPGRGSHTKSEWLLAAKRASRNKMKIGPDLVVNGQSNSIPVNHVPV